MLRNIDRSDSFYNFIERNHAPVIMQILPALNSGGVEQGVIDINATIVESGGRSIVLSNGGLRQDEIIQAGGQHFKLPVHSKNPFVIAANVERIRKIIRDENVDIVHACSRAPAWSAGQAVKGTSARYVTSCHSAHSLGNKLKQFYNSSVTKGERVIAVSNFLGDYVLQNYSVNPDVLRVIHRGVSLKRFDPASVTQEQRNAVRRVMQAPEGKKIILLPARITRSKGHKFLLDAVKHLGRDDVFCVLLGSSIGFENYKADLEQYIEAAGMKDKACIVSGCDMPASYAAASVVLAPSLTPEGFGRVPIEAQAMGKPVITTDHGGMRETVLRDETGWLVKPGDVEGLSALLGRVLDMTPETLRGLGVRAREHVAQNFTIERMGQSTLDVYAELLIANEHLKDVLSPSEKTHHSVAA